MIVIAILFYLAFLGFYIYVGWKVFEKAGQPGWASIIPIYGTIVMLKIIGKPWWWIFILWFPVFGIWATNLLSKSFGKDVGYTLGLLFLGFIFFPMLAFGDAKYIGPAGDPAAFAAAQQPHFDFDAKPAM
ncbi:hypothetical protein A3860_27135 [Niastella vici]|uniref:Signal peptidase I n=1 Tax=Niastella vici TaxID=1703345 RepID=A0A1V9FWE4_9BACT|nr:DUF5684 domain-containing protein [Niastella vici]OQP62689.1 hypothetical protein A3860_27135 [Niastella vici]